MAQIFKNAYSIDVGTSFVELYAPAGEVTWSIISGMTIANKKLNEILVDVRIIDSTNLVTAYLCVNSKLSVGSSLALAGDLQKIILKPGDSIEIKSNEVDSIDVYMNAIENDPSVSYGGSGPLAEPWAGDFAFVTAGDLGYASVSTYVFTSQVTESNIGNMTTAREQACGASNQTIGLVLGGYTSSEKNDTQAFAFAGKSWTYSWSYLTRGLRLGGSCSNGTNYMWMGGYDGSAEYDADIGDFASGSTATWWGSSATAYYSGGAGNSIYAIQLGGYNNEDYMGYYTWASQSNYSFWGNMYYSTSYKSSGAGNETRALLLQGEFSNNRIQVIEFSSMGNTGYWGNLASTNDGMGAVSNGNDQVLFTCGTVGSVCELVSLEAASNATQITGLYDFNGQQPVSESGNG